jgi:HAE1 family hydrophobic/amphiphilic exporter-1
MARRGIKRVRGVGDVRIFGERKFSMRLWLDPTELARRKLTPQDVTRAARAPSMRWWRRPRSVCAPS